MTLEVISGIVLMLLLVGISVLLCFCAVKGIESYDKTIAKHEEEVKRLEKELEAIKRGDWKEE